MTRINTNIASLRGLRSLNKSTQALDTAMTRLSTGLKINSGRDNPSGLIASEGLRTQISAIEQSIKNSNRANNVIATADSALGEIGGLLTQVRGLVQEGLNTGALSQDEIEANQLQIDNALSAINRIASNTKFGSDRLIDGSKSFNTTVSSTDAAKLSDLTINEAVVGSAGQIALSANVSTAATQASLLYGGGALSGAVTLEVGGSRGSEVISLGNASTTANVRDAINNSTDSTGVTARLLTGHTLDLAATSSTLTSGAGTSAITFDRVATGSDATLGSTLQVELVQGAAFATSVSGDVLTITADFATGVTSDALAILVNGDATASALVAATGSGAGNVVAAAAADLAGGTDAASLVLSDTRTDTSAGAISYSVAAGGVDSNVAISVAGTAITITAGTLATLDDVAAALNADASASALVTALSDGDSTALAGTLASTNLAADGGALTLESLAYGSDEYVNVNVLSGTFGTYGEDGAEVRRDAGTDIGVTINGFEAIGRGLRATLRASNVDASLTFTEAANAVGTTAAVTINGGGAVFQIGQEVSAAGQVGIGIDAINTARLGSVSGKLYELGSGAGKSLIDITRGDAQGVDVVKIIEEAINEVSTLRGRLGAVQKNVIDTNIATLGVALENITEARSQIVDTDFAEETAALTKAQVLNQAGIAVLSIANQNPQQVLQLLG